MRFAQIDNNQIPVQQLLLQSYGKLKEAESLLCRFEDGEKLAKGVAIAAAQIFFALGEDAGYLQKAEEKKEGE